MNCKGKYRTRRLIFISNIDLMMMLLKWYIARSYPVRPSSNSSRLARRGHRDPVHEMGGVVEGTSCGFGSSVSCPQTTLTFIIVSAATAFVQSSIAHGTNLSSLSTSRGDPDATNISNDNSNNTNNIIIGNHEHHNIAILNPNPNPNPDINPNSNTNPNPNVNPNPASLVHLQHHRHGYSLIQNASSYAYSVFGNLSTSGSGLPDNLTGRDLVSAGELPATRQIQWSMLILTMVILCTAVGNLLVCLAVCWERRLQNMTNYFLMSLAIADFLVSLLVMPLGMIIQMFGEYIRSFIILSLYTRL